MDVDQPAIVMLDEVGVRMRMKPASTTRSGLNPVDPGGQGGVEFFAGFVVAVVQRIGGHAVLPGDFQADARWGCC